MRVMCVDVYAMWCDMLACDVCVMRCDVCACDMFWFPSLLNRQRALPALFSLTSPPSLPRRSFPLLLPLASCPHSHPYSPSTLDFASALGQDAALAMPPFESGQRESSSDDDFDFDANQPLASRRRRSRGQDNFHLSLDARGRGRGRGRGDSDDDGDDDDDDDDDRLRDNLSEEYASAFEKLSEEQRCVHVCVCMRACAF